MNFFDRILIALHLKKKPNPTISTPVITQPPVVVPAPVVITPPTVSLPPAPVVVSPAPVVPTVPAAPISKPPVATAPPVQYSPLPPTSIDMAHKLKAAKDGGYVSPAYQNLLKTYGQDGVNHLESQYSEQGNWGGDPALASQIRDIMLA